MKLQKYVIKALFDTKSGVDVEILPIFEISKEEVIRKLNENMKLYKNFSLYGFDWSTDEIVKYGLPEILTVSEFWREDGYV